MIATAIIVAAGSSKRLGSKINKPYLELNGKALLCHSLSAFAGAAEIKEIIVVIRKEDEELCRSVVRHGCHKNVRFIEGGKERQDSVYNGLKKVRKDCKLVLVHDAARPFIDTAFVEKLINTASKHRAVVPVLHVKETVKRSSTGKYIDETLDRKKLFLAQTPQVFDYRLLLKAYERAVEDNFYGTDDSMLVERMGTPVMLVPGDERNIKITVKEDLK